MGAAVLVNAPMAPPVAAYTAAASTKERGGAVKPQRTNRQMQTPTTDVLHANAFFQPDVDNNVYFLQIQRQQWQTAVTSRWILL